VAAPARDCARARSPSVGLRLRGSRAHGYATAAGASATCVPPGRDLAVTSSDGRDHPTTYNNTRRCRNLSIHSHVVGGMAQLLDCQSLAGGLSLIYG